jgi:uncharacterized protein (TIGR03545 family)
MSENTENPQTPPELPEVPKEESKEDKKKDKKGGMLRKGAIIPFVIFITVVTLFNILLLDITIQKTVEHFGTRFNGAEVNVGDVETSLSDLSFNIKGIEVTDPSNPSLNRVQIGRAGFSLLWDGILRAKFVVEEAGVNDIRIQTKRKYPGALVKEDENYTKASSAAAQKSLKAAREEFKGNIFGDVAAVLSGVDSKTQGKEVEGDLKSKKRYEEIEKEIDTKEEEWKKVMKDLPGDDDFDAIKKRMKAINFKDLGNLKKAKGVLKEIKAVKNDINATVKKYNDASKKIKGDISYIKNSIKEVENLVKEDVKSLEKRMNIPSLDAENISRVLFGNEFASKVAEAQRYMDMAKEYMPEKEDPKKAAEKKAKKSQFKPERGKGKDYQFGTPKTYPKLWVKLVNIDSKNADGTIDGTIKDITSDQATLNRSTVININADFPPKGIRGVRSNITLDHRRGIRDVMETTISSYPIDEKKLSNSSDMKFNIKSASAKMRFNGKMIDEQVIFAMDNTLTKVNYEVDAKSKSMKSILTSVAEETPQINIIAAAKGTWKKLNWKIKTNLADSLKRGMNNQVKKKVDEMKKRVEDSIQKKIAGNKNKVQSKLTGAQDKYLGKLTSGKGKANDLISGLDKEAEKGKKSKAKKQMNKLKKKLKLKF